MIAAALSHEWEQVRGIEILQSLYEESLKLKMGYEFMTNKKNISLIRADIF